MLLGQMREPLLQCSGQPVIGAEIHDQESERSGMKEAGGGSTCCVRIRHPKDGKCVQIDRFRVGERRPTKDRRHTTAL